MRKLSLLLFLSLFVRVTYAQYVTIADTAFANWLQNNGFGTCMSGNELDTTCASVLNADTIGCTKVPVRNLTGIQYFKSLRGLNCSDDSLTFIPSFPASLVYINLWNNQLTDIPALPAGLKALDCSVNRLNNLPELPATLLTLACSVNLLYFLPDFPSGMTAIQCDNNQFQSIPALPDSLRILTCSSNGIFTIPALPPLLFELDCGGNKITSLPTLPASLQVLYCTDNPLTTLPDLPPNFTSLNCSFDLLTALPELPDSMSYLNCSYNSGLTCLPTLKRIVAFDFYGTAITCLPDTDSITTSSPALSSLPLCGPNGCTVSGVHQLFGTNTTFEVYPNPATGKLYTDYPLHNAQLKIFDMTGKIWPVTSLGNEMDISALSPGLYCLSIESAGNNTVVKFAKE